MERCACVERELDKVLQKFLCYGQHCERGLEELLVYVSQLREELSTAGTGAASARPPASRRSRRPPETNGLPTAGVKKALCR